MYLAQKKKKLFAALSTVIIAQLAYGQPVEKRLGFSSTTYQTYTDYFEKKTYIGKHRDYFTVGTYLKDSSLYSTEVFKAISERNAYGDKVISYIRQGLAKIVYKTGRLYLSCTYAMNLLNGPFTVYYPDGSLKRKEIYYKGTLKRGTCYDTLGHEQACEPFFRDPQFLGTSQALTTYFEANLMPIINENKLLGSINVTIDQTGQVTAVRMQANKDDETILAAVREVIQSVPHPNGKEAVWQPATMDGVPIDGNWTIKAYRDGDYLRISFPK